MKPFKATVVLGMALVSTLGGARSASAQYYGGYYTPYRPTVYRTMPVRPVLPPPTYARPQYRPYERPYVQPYPGRPLPPYEPTPTFPRGRTSVVPGLPQRPGLPIVCRGVRSTVCYGGQRPGVGW